MIANKRIEDFTGSDTSITEPYIVTCSHTDSVPTILASGVLPAVGDYHPASSLFKIEDGGIVFETRPKRGNSTTGGNAIWYVTVTYSKQFGTFGHYSLDRLISFEVGQRSYMRTAESAYERAVYEEDATEPIVGSSSESEFKNISCANSATDIFDPADLQEEYCNPVLIFTQYELSTFDSINAIKMQGTLNDDDITIFGIKVLKGSGLTRKISPRIVKVDNQTRWQCSYEIELTQEIRGFWLKPLDRGFYAINETQGRYEITNADIKDAHGDEYTDTDQATPASEPQLLNGQGDIMNYAGSHAFVNLRTLKYTDWKASLNLIITKPRL